MITNQEKKCIKLARHVRLNHQWRKIKDIEAIVDSYDYKFITLPITLILLALHLIYHVIINEAKMFSIAVELPLIPKNRSFYNFWLLHGLDDSFNNAIRLDMLKQWLAILYPDEQFDIDDRLSELLKGHCHASKAGILASNKDSIDYIAKDLGLDLPDYQ